MSTTAKTFREVMVERAQIASAAGDVKKAAWCKDIARSSKNPLKEKTDEIMETLSKAIREMEMAPSKKAAEAIQKACDESPELAARYLNDVSAPRGVDLRKRARVEASIEEIVAKKRSIDPMLSEHEAIGQVLKENPKLYELYINS